MSTRANSTAKRKPLHVMEYLDDSASMIIGWAFLAPAEHAKWKKARAGARPVSGFFVIDDLSLSPEFASTSSARLFDYGHEIDQATLLSVRVADLPAHFRRIGDDDDQPPADV